MEFDYYEHNTCTCITATTLSSGSESDGIGYKK